MSVLKLTENRSKSRKQVSTLATGASLIEANTLVCSTFYYINGTKAFAERSHKRTMQRACLYDLAYPGLNEA